MEPKIDRRVRRTETVLKEALVELLERKDLDEITVTEISDYADIYRGTFYLHYKDIYDLFYNIECSFLAEFQKYVMLYLHKNKPDMFDFFEKLYEYFFTKRSVLQTLLCTNKSKLLDKIIEIRYPNSF